MKARHLWLISGLLLVAATTGLVLANRADAENTKKTVDFSMKDLNGKKVKLSHYRGKVVVIDVWATWCGYCVREIPDLIDMQADAAKNKTPLQIIGISVDDNKGAVKAFAKKHDFTYPVLYAEDRGMKPFGEIYGLPTKFIIDKNGVIVDKIIGAVDRKDLEKRLEKYLK